VWGVGQVRGKLNWYHVEAKLCCVHSACSANLRCLFRTQLEACCVFAFAVEQEWLEGV
jgi:hypothetical protein